MHSCCQRAAEEASVAFRPPDLEKVWPQEQRHADRKTELPVARSEASGKMKIKSKIFSVNEKAKERQFTPNHQRRNPAHPL